MRRSEYALPRRRYGLERRHGLAEIVERGSLILEERQRVKPPHSEKGNVSLAENASCHGYNLAHQRTGFFVATKTLHEALSVREAEVAMLRRAGDPEEDILQAQNNLANTYEVLGRRNEALSMQREAYAAKLKLYGEEDIRTIGAAYNVANALLTIDRPEEGKALIRKLTPVARRVLGESHDLTLRIRTCYAISIYQDDSATLDDLREAANTLEDSERIARRVLGGAHPLTKAIEQSLWETRKRIQN